MSVFAKLDCLKARISVRRELTSRIVSAARAFLGLRKEHQTANNEAKRNGDEKNRLDQCHRATRPDPTAAIEQALTHYDTPLTSLTYHRSMFLSKVHGSGLRLAGRERREPYSAATFTWITGSIVSSSARDRWHFT
jgi:hypothetical protein